MIVRVDLTDGTVALDEPDVLDAFKVVAIGGADAAAVGAVLDDAGAGSAADDPGHVWVAIDALRLLAEDQVDEGWSTKFDDMVFYASTKDWVDEAGTSIKAHVEPA